MSKYPRCAQCDKPLGVRAGIERGGVKVCSPECEYLYFGPPAPSMEVVITGSVFRANLEELRKMNPDTDEAGILALYYLGWQNAPTGGSDHEIFLRVREWCKE